MVRKKNSVFNSYILFWKNAFNFKGRTRRSDYWHAYAINNIAIPFIMWFLNFTGNDTVQMVTAIIYYIHTIITLIPYLSITIRRLHDVGKDTYYFLIFFLPVVGQVIIFINLLKDSVKETNRYGESPKYIPEPEKAKPSEEICPVCKSPISSEDYMCHKCGSPINREEIYGQL